jgi:hypothetical protein
MVQFVGAAIGCVEMIRSSNHMDAAGVVVDPFAPLKYGWRMIPCRPTVWSDGSPNVKFGRFMNCFRG